MSVGKFEDIENALRIWIDVKESRNNPISDNIFRSNAENFAKQVGIENFNLSIETLGRLKKERVLCHSRL